MHTSAAYAKFDSDSWPKGSSPEEIGARVAERFVSTSYNNFGRTARPVSITYPETCTWYGALTFAKLSKDSRLTKKLMARFDPLFGADADLVPKNDHVDPSVFGAVPFELYLQTKDARYLTIGRPIADRQWAPLTVERLASLKPDERQIVEQAAREGLSPQTRYWIDDMYMVTLLQAQAFRATGESKYIERAALEMTKYVQKLKQPNGLYHHAPDAPFYWGRGNGWMAAGMTELLRALPFNHPSHTTILTAYREMMFTLLEFQGEDGMWRQLVDRRESWPETSCTGMFTFAMLTGARQGWLDAGMYEPAARKGWLGLVNYINEAGDIREVCEGTDKKNDLQYYLDRKRVIGDLHGQAPLLWCASAFLR